MIAFPMSWEDSFEFNHLIAEFLNEELTEVELPDGNLDFAIHADRFPSWPWLQHREKCDRVLPELALMAADTGFEHHLSPLYRFVLFKSVQQWEEVEREAAIGDDTEEHARDREARAERLQDLCDQAFEDIDFLNPGLIAKIAFEHAELQQELDIKVGDYLELMPDDVRGELETLLARAKRDSSS
jgi:hypothetical protein